MPGGAHAHTHLRVSYPSPHDRRNRQRRNSTVELDPRARNVCFVLLNEFTTNTFRTFHCSAPTNTYALSAFECRSPFRLFTSPSRGSSNNAIVTRWTQYLRNVYRETIVVLNACTQHAPSFSCLHVSVLSLCAIALENCPVTSLILPRLHNFFTSIFIFAPSFLHVSRVSWIIPV